MSETKYANWVQRGGDLLGEVHDVAVDTAPRLKFDIAAQGWSHIYAVGFYASLIEVSGSCVALARAKAYVGIPILARTCFEAYVDLKNLIADDKYILHLEVKRCKEWLKILDEAQGGENAYVAGIAIDPEFAKHREEYEQGRKTAMEAGGKDLKAYERFELAGQKDAYGALYNFLCAESHNNGRALMRRHLDMSKDPPQLMMYDSEPGFVIPSLSTIASMLLDATEWMHERFAEKALSLSELRKKAHDFDAELIASKT